MVGTKMFISKKHYCADVHNSEVNTKRKTETAQCLAYEMPTIHIL